MAKMKQYKKLKLSITNAHNQKGVALLEALIALLIFSMGILALVGLQSAMITNTSDSKYRADASYLVQQRLSMIWANPADATLLATKASVDGPVANLLPNGVRTVTTIGAAANGQIRITVQWQAPTDTAPHQTSVEARVKFNP